MAQITLNVDGQDQSSFLESTIESLANGETLEINSEGGGVALLDEGFEITKSVKLLFTYGGVRRGGNGAAMIRPLGGDIVIDGWKLVGVNNSSFFVETFTNSNLDSLRINNNVTDGQGVLVSGKVGDVLIEKNRLGIDPDGSATMTLNGPNDKIKNARIMHNTVHRKSLTGNCFQITNMINDTLVLGNISYGGGTGFDGDDGLRTTYMACRAFDFGDNGFVLKKGSGRQDKEISRGLVFVGNHAASCLIGTNGFDYRLSTPLIACVAEGCSTGFTMLNNPSNAQLVGCYSEDVKGIDVNIESGNVSLIGHTFINSNLPVRIGGGDVNIEGCTFEDFGNVQAIQSSGVTSGESVIYLTRNKVMMGSGSFVRVGPNAIVHELETVLPPGMSLKHGAANQGPLYKRSYNVVEI